MESSPNESKTMGAKQQPGTPAVEWAFAIIGALIVAGIIGFNIIETASDNDTPPDIQVEVQKQVRTSRGFLVQFKATNIGGSSAAGLMIEGALNDKGKEVEVSEVTFDYVPAHSTKEGGLFFVHDPREMELKLRVLGYQDP